VVAAIARQKLPTYDDENRAPDCTPGHSRSGHSLDDKQVATRSCSDGCAGGGEQRQRGRGEVEEQKGCDTTLDTSRCTPSDENNDKVSASSANHNFPTFVLFTLTHSPPPTSSTPRDPNHVVDPAERSRCKW